MGSEFIKVPGPSPLPFFGDTGGLKNRHEEYIRIVNDLMESFRARASTAAGSSCDVKKKPAASARSDLKKT